VTALLTSAIWIRTSSKSPELADLNGLVQWPVRLATKKIRRRAAFENITR